MPRLHPLPLLLDALSSLRLSSSFSTLLNMSSLLLLDTWFWLLNTLLHLLGRLLHHLLPNMRLKRLMQMRIPWLLRLGGRIPSVLFIVRVPMGDGVNVHCISITDLHSPLETFLSVGMPEGSPLLLSYRSLFFVLFCILLDNILTLLLVVA